jgi:hypothetical protein
MTLGGLALEAGLRGGQTGPQTLLLAGQGAACSAHKRVGVFVHPTCCSLLVECGIGYQPCVTCVGPACQGVQGLLGCVSTSQEDKTIQGLRASTVCVGMALVGQCPMC